MNERREFFRGLAAAALGARQGGEPAAADPAAAPEPSRAAELARSSVLVVGAGALAATASSYLVGAGVGRIGIVDETDAEPAAADLRLIGPEVLAEPYPAEFSEPMVAGQDLVLDCTGRPDVTRAVNAACCAAQVPCILAVVTRSAGRVMTVLPGKSGCHACAFPPGSGYEPEGDESGLTGPPAAGVVGSLVAIEALRRLTGEERDAWFLAFDVRGLSVQHVIMPRRPDCPACGPLG